MCSTNKAALLPHNFIELAESCSAIQVCDALGSHPPLFEVLHFLSTAELDDPCRSAIYRELLRRFSFHSDWDKADEAGVVSIETILLTLSTLRFDHREDEEESLLAAVRTRPGREDVAVAGGLRMGREKPCTLAYDGNLWICDTDLTDWRPRNILASALEFTNCTGILELGEAFVIGDPKEHYYSTSPVLEVNPDLEVRGSLESLAGRPVARVFEDGLRVQYFLPDLADGWVKGELESVGMDLTMPVNYRFIPTVERLRELPLGAITELDITSLESLPDTWAIPACLRLCDWPNLKSLPGDLRFEPVSLSDRCLRHSIQDRFDPWCLWLEACPSLETLPPSFSLPLGLRLDRVALKTLPENLQVEGLLTLSNCPIERLPEQFRCGGLLLEEVPLTHLPEGLHINGNLHLDGLTKLQALPEGLRVDGELELRSCPTIRDLPSDLQAEGGLRIFHCVNLTEFPIFEIPMDLDLCTMPDLRELPIGFHVGGNLIIAGCGLRSLPGNLRVDGHLILENLSDLEVVPPTIRVGTSLLIRGCPSLHPIETGLIIPIDLAIDEMPWHDLPRGIKVGRDLGLKNLPNFCCLPNEYSDLPGELWLERLPSLLHLPDGLHVGTELIILNCPNLSLPPGLSACAVECPAKLMEKAGFPIENWRPSRGDEPSLAPVLQEISSTLGDIASSFEIMAHSPEFLVCGELTPEGAYRLWIEDRSGIGHEDAHLATLQSSSSGYFHAHSKFVLAPLDLERLYRQVWETLASWGFGRTRKVIFTTTGDWTLVKDVMQRDPEPQMWEGGTVKPYVIHLSFWRHDFELGSTLTPLGGDPILRPELVRLMSPSDFRPIHEP